MTIRDSRLVKAEGYDQIYYRTWVEDGKFYFEFVEPERIQKDQLRTEYINQQGVSVLRFTNIDVQHNFYGVCTCIDEAVQKYQK